MNTKLKVLELISRGYSSMIDLNGQPGDAGSHIGFAFDNWAQEYRRENEFEPNTESEVDSVFHMLTSLGIYW